MGDHNELSDDERAAIGRDAGIPWQRVCPACGHHPAAVGVYADDPAELDDLWLGCPACGEEWQAPGVRYVLAEVPPLDSPELDAFVEEFVAALKAGARSPSEDGSGRPGRR